MLYLKVFTVVMSIWGEGEGEITFKKEEVNLIIVKTTCI